MEHRTFLYNGRSISRLKAKEYQDAAVDAMTWKQFLVYTNTGKYPGKSKAIISQMLMASEWRKTAGAYQRRINLELNEGVANA